jgi:uncharacterized SAM-dependent methyltransferase
MTITVHGSQFPDRVAEDLRQSLRQRVVNHKFHYDSVKQAQKWLRLHRACSPAAIDPECGRIYDAAFIAASDRCGRESPVHLTGLGCGGGVKDARLLRILAERVPPVTYAPCDVSAALAMTASQAAWEVIPKERVFPLICDLGSGLDLAAALAPLTPLGTRRVFTFFGMLPNFEPGSVLGTVRAAMGSGELLLLSANLAPGSDYAAGMRTILPQYDNEPTRDWLLTFLLDLGLERNDGELEFRIQDASGGLKRVIVHFRFVRDCSVGLGEETIAFSRGERIQVFFSYRHTPERLGAMLAEFGLRLVGNWISGSGEEGVFLCLPEA